VWQSQYRHVMVYVRKGSLAAGTATGAPVYTERPKPAYDVGAFVRHRCFTCVWGVQ